MITQNSPESNLAMTKFNTQLAFRGMILLALPLVLFTIINLSPGIPSVNQIISRVPSDLALTFIPLILFTLSNQRKGSLGYFYTTGLLAIFYGLLLKWFWTTGYSEGGTQLWGYLPTSDVISYYQEAYGLLAGNGLHGAATFRPISTLFVSSLLWFSNLNPMTSLWVFVYFNVLGSLVASNEVRKTHGSIAAAIYLTAGLLFYQFYIGTMMTEQLGFLLANLAFACFWNSIRSDSLKKALLGLFVLSLGLNVRAGAMFILLVLPVWIGIQFGGKGFAFKWASLALVIALSGFAINSLMVKFVVPNSGTMFSNFGFTLYGVAVGNKGWYQIVRDFPGVTHAESMQIAINQIISDPLLFVRGVINTYLDYFNPTTCWAYCYLQLGSKASNFLVLIFSSFGVVSLLKKWKNSLPLFIVVALVGVLISVPFAPTRDVGYRAYTMTNPFLTSLLFVGFPWASEVWKRTRQLPKEVNTLEINCCKRDHLFKILYPLLSLTLVLALVIPVITYKAKPLLPLAAQQNCEEDEIKVDFQTNRDAWVHVVQPADLPEGISIPYATLDTLTNLVNNSPYHLKRSFTDSVQYARPGHSIGYAPYYYPDNTQTPRFSLIMVVVNTSDLPMQTGRMQFCAKDVTTVGTESNYVRTYIATNLKRDCTNCGNRVYDSGIVKLSTYSLIGLVGIMLLDCLSDLIPIRKRKNL